MPYRLLADAVVIFHFCFVAFVIGGGLLVLRWRRLMWLHLPAVAWGIYIELSHGICPLTPLENHLREAGGGSAYQGDFVDHYIMPVLYPEGLTEQMQVALACIIVAINTVCYTIIIRRYLRRRRSLRQTGFEAFPPEAAEAGHAGAESTDAADAVTTGATSHSASLARRSDDPTAV